MKSDDGQQAKKDLLRELESLREQLAGPEGDHLNDDIPILLDKVEQVVSATPDAELPGQLDDETAALQAAYQQATEDLQEREASESPDAQQRHLFAQQPEERKAAGKSPTQPRPVPRGENPFLPKHIRDRLSERRQLLADDIAQASSFFPSKPEKGQSFKPASTPSAHQQVIDELVADYLPRIERELRRRLEQLLEARPPEDEER